MSRETTPTITISYAQSVDGKIATATGDSRWISCSESLDFAHSLRGEHDSIMVGIGTVLADDPLLTCRIPDCQSPHRIVLDSSLRLPLEANITQSAARVPTTAICSRDALANTPAHAEALRSSGVRVVAVERDNSGLSLPQVFHHLREEGLNSVFVEGGSRLITTLIREQWAKRLIVVFAPLFIGKGCEAIGDLQVNALADAQRATPISVTQYGCDIAWELSLDPAKRDTEKKTADTGAGNRPDTQIEAQQPIGLGDTS